MFCYCRSGSGHEHVTALASGDDGLCGGDLIYNIWHRPSQVAGIDIGSAGCKCIALLQQLHAGFEQRALPGQFRVSL